MDGEMSQEQLEEFVLRVVSKIDRGLSKTFDRYGEHFDRYGEHFDRIILNAETEIKGMRADEQQYFDIFNQITGDILMGFKRIHNHWNYFEAENGLPNSRYGHFSSLSDQGRVGLMAKPGESNAEGYHNRRRLPPWHR